jgi:hypothetical protein
MDRGGEYKSTRVECRAFSWRRRFKERHRIHKRRGREGRDNAWRGVERKREMERERKRENGRGRGKEKMGEGEETST